MKEPKHAQFQKLRGTGHVVFIVTFLFQRGVNSAILVNMKTFVVSVAVEPFKKFT